MSYFNYCEDVFYIDQYGNVVEGNPYHSQVKLSFTVEWIDLDYGQFEGTEISVDLWNDIEVIQGKPDIYSLFEEGKVQTIYSKFDDSNDMKEITWHTLNEYNGNSHHISMVEMCLVDWIMKKHPVALDQIMFSVEKFQPDDYFYPYSLRRPKRYITARIFDHWISCDDDIKMEDN